MADGAESPAYVSSAYTVHVTIGMPDGTDRKATVPITDDSTDRFIGLVTAAVLHLRRQRHAMERRMAEAEARP